MTRLTYAKFSFLSFLQIYKKKVKLVYFAVCQNRTDNYRLEDGEFTINIRLPKCFLLKKK
jgi:hypothetical protein